MEAYDAERGAAARPQTGVIRSPNARQADSPGGEARIDHPLSDASPRNDSPGSVGRLARERDLYRTLLELGAHDRLEDLIDRALSLVARLAGARRGYIEIVDEREAGVEPLRWCVSTGCSALEVERIQGAVSHGIIAEAMATGRPVVTASALLDRRFSDRASVRANQIEAVLCVPIGDDSALGVVYLQDRNEPGAFSEDEVSLCQTFARHLAVFAERLLVKRRLDDFTDPTEAHRRRLRLSGFVGRSNAIAETLEQVALVAPLDVCVLLTGESGTGKTQLARILHDNSRRASEPFVELNCAAIPESLLESELFGAAPGAHSTATRRLPGKLAAAEHGTLFLDEVSELSPRTQAKLLQFLQSREYFPLGSTTKVLANVRVIAATNVDLHERVRQRAFREDLLYRLEVLPIVVPSLTERTDDVPQLVSYFCERAARAHGFAGLSPSPGTVRAARLARWPGNVRQLAHAVEAAVIRAGGAGSRMVERDHLFPRQTRSKDETEPLTYQEATRRFQVQLLEETLRKTGWNVTRAAEELDLARSHAYKLIRAFGLHRSQE